MKVPVPPTLTVPAPVNWITELVPEEVIEPAEVTVPVDSEIVVDLPEVVVPDSVIEAQDKVPDPTASVIVLADGLAILTAPVVVNVFPLSAKVELSAETKLNVPDPISPVRVAVPPVLFILTAPVVVKVPIFCAEVVPVIVTIELPAVSVPALMKSP